MALLSYYVTALWQLSNIHERQERIALVLVMWNSMNGNWSQAAFCWQIHETLPFKSDTYTVRLCQWRWRFLWKDKDVVPEVSIWSTMELILRHPLAWRMHRALEACFCNNVETMNRNMLFACLMYIIYMYIYIYIYIYKSTTKQNNIRHSTYITLFNSRRFEYKLFFRLRQSNDWKTIRWVKFTYEKMRQIYKYMYIYTYIHIYICMYICTYIHIYI